MNYLNKPLTNLIAVLCAVVIGLALLVGGVQSTAQVPVVGSQGLTFGTSNFGGSISVAGNAAIGGTSVFTGASTFQAAMNVNANLDADSISTAGNIDMTTMNNTGASPVTINDDLTITGTLIYSTESITPADGLTITPTASLVTLTPGGAVGITLAPCTNGMTTVLYNSVNANVVITDTGDAVLAGDQTLGQYDTLPLACFDSNWVQTGPVSAN